MIKQTKLKSRQFLFALKAAACLSGLLLGFCLFAPKARMQNGEAVISNANSALRMNGNYRPTPEPPKSTVRGRVFYEDTGRAVKRASIMLMGKGGRSEASGLTDGNGVFQIKNVAAGTYYAFVNAPGVVSPLAYADLAKAKNDGFDEAVEGFPPIIVSGANDLDVQIPARRGGAVGGRVMYADGDPAIGVKVEIMRKVKERFVSVIPNFSSLFSMMGGGGGGSQTDDRGVYRFAGLPDGEYVVKVTENVSHSSNLPRGYGAFAETLFGNSSMLTMFYPDAFTTEKAQLISVAAGQETSEINIYIPDRSLYAVEGRIINAKDRTPIKNVAVSLKKTGEDTFSVFDDFGKRQQKSTSNEQGIWSFREMPKGTYTLIVEPSEYEYEADGYPSNSMYSNSNRSPNAPPKPKLAKTTREITIDSENLSEIVIELGYGATVSGTVKTEDNQPMPSRLTITASQDDSETGSAATIYNSSGGSSAYAGNFNSSGVPSKPNHDFKLEGVTAGKNYLWAKVDGDDFYVKSAMFSGTDLLLNPVELKEGDVLRNVQFVISKAVGTLKGTVADSEKQPAQKAELMLIPVEAGKRKNPNFSYSAVTKENGEFEIKAAPGEYAVVFYAKDFNSKKGAELDRWLEEAVKNAVKVNLKSRETEKIALILPK